MKRRPQALTLARDWLVYVAVRMFICTLQAMRIETCHSVARVLAVVASDVLRIRRGVVDDNLRHAFEQLSARERRDLSRRMWEHLLLLICEVAHVPRKLHNTNWRDHIEFRNKREMLRLLLNDRPTVIVSGHFGNFEVAGFALSLLGFPTYTIARPLDNPFLNRFLNKFRGASGQYMLPKVGSAKQIALLLDASETLVLLGDQFGGPKGCWVDFFGRPASCHKAVALFSMTSGAPMIVGYALRRDRPMRFEIGAADLADTRDGDGPLANVRSATQWYSASLEGVIRRVPEQYWWLHRRWKDPRPKRKPPQTSDRAAA